MTCQHVGHDHDTDCDPECPTCGEFTHDPASHLCHDMAWLRVQRDMQDRINRVVAALAAADHMPTTYEVTTFADPEPVIEWCCQWHKRRNQEPA